MVVALVQGVFHRWRENNNVSME